VVEVEHREGQAAARPSGADELGAHPVAEGGAVQEARERIGRGALEEAAFLVHDGREEKDREEDEAGADRGHDRSREEDRVPLRDLRETGEEKAARGGEDERPRPPGPVAEIEEEEAGEEGEERGGARVDGV
jgi:hypothetical protein